MSFGPSAAGDRSVAAQRIDGTVITGDGATVTVVGEGPGGYRLEVLTPTEQRWVPRSQRTPSYLLDPGREVVPYRARPVEQEALKRWRDDEEPASVLLVHGAGGQGKTRLAGWLATDSYAADWVVMRAVEKTVPTRLTVSEQLHAYEAPLLVVVDYAERWPIETLIKLVESVTVDHEGRRARILLLARPQVGFWENVYAGLDRMSVDIPEPLRLGGFTADGGEAFADAVSAFQDALELPRTSLEMPRKLIKDQSPLTLYMAALVAVHAYAERQEVPKPAALSRFLLSHERRHWQASAQSSAEIGTAVLLASLFGPVADMAEAGEWLRRAHLADGEREVRSLLNAYRLIYPPDASEGQVPDILTPLRPDRFAEDFIAEQLDDPLQVQLVTELLSDERTDLMAVRRALIMLAAAGRYPAVRKMLFPVLEDQSRVVSQANSQLIELVIRHADPNTTLAVEKALPDYSTELIRSMCDLTRHIIDNLPEDAPLTERANWLMKLDIRLGEAGDRPGALQISREVVEIFRRLDSSEPLVHRANLAMALNNLAESLAQSGNRSQALRAAQESVEIYQHFPDFERAIILPGYAMALNNLGLRLAALGEPEAALKPTLKAVSMYRWLSKSNPTVHLPDLAMAVNNLGLTAGNMGDSQRALKAIQEAVDIYRQLAEGEPARYLPRFADALNGLGARLVMAGDRQAALAPSREAVSIHRKLVEVTPGAFLPGLALALYNLGVSESAVNAFEVAAKVSKEAIAIYRPLAEAEPGAYLPDLAKALNNLGSFLCRSEGAEEGVAAAREAVHILERLTRVEPGAHLAALLAALATLASAEIESGHRAGDLAFAIAAETCERLTRELPDEFRQRLAAARVGFLKMSALSGVE